MSNATVLEIAQQMGKIFNELDEKIAHELVAPGFVDYEAPPGTPGGPSGYLGTARWMNSVFSEASWDHIDSFADGDKAVIRVRFTGIHTGDFLGFEGTGNKVDVEHIHIYRVGDDGLVHEHWACRQDLFLLAQIGAVELKLPPAGTQA
ncbi:ester cyclase [Streptomyces sp. NPDC055105]|uniref:ester cyclase n=1 Tax=Streptomyces sp. NPDC055105 TaxID=3365719 RepID=UPI0037D16080